MNELKPKLFDVLKDYSKEQAMRDVISGIIVAIIALPLSIALAIASGVGPEQGLYTAIIAGFFISFFGGSRVQIGGPTAAFVVIIYGIVADYGTAGLTVATILAGIFLIVMGICHFGSLIKYIPYTITTGFTCGIAVTLFVGQLKDFFGLSIASVPSGFVDKVIAYATNISTINWTATAVGAAAIVIMLLWPKVTDKIPGSLIAIIVTTAVVYFAKLPVNTIGSVYGELSSSFPTPHVPALSMKLVQEMLSPAFTIALLAGIESLLSAVVSDGMIGDTHKSNAELIGQGLANITVPFFGGIPVTGAIARTMTNITNGGRTPVAGVVHAVVLLLIFIFLMPLINYVPMACLAAVLVMVSYNMSGWRTIRGMLKNPKSDISVMTVTFLLTVVFDLTIAIEIGLLLAIVLFLRRVMENTEIKVYSEQLDVAEGTDLDASHHEVLDVKPGVEVYEIDGPFFFGVATKFDEMMRSTLGEKPKVRIVRMRKVPFIDSTAIHNLEILITSSQKENIHVVLSGVKENVRQTLMHAGIDRLIGADHICPHISVAVKMANAIVEKENVNEKTA